MWLTYKYLTSMYTKQSTYWGRFTAHLFKFRTHTFRRDLDECTTASNESACTLQGGAWEGVRPGKLLSLHLLKRFWFSLSSPLIASYLCCLYPSGHLMIPELSAPSSRRLDILGCKHQLFVHHEADAVGKLCYRDDAVP
jgi:hypothetical protein